MTLRRESDAARPGRSPRSRARTSRGTRIRAPVGVGGPGARRRREPRPRSARAPSAPAEACLALLGERRDAFAEVVGLRHLGLRLGLPLELVLERGGRRLVEE